METRLKVAVGNKVLGVVVINGGIRQALFVTTILTSKPDWLSVLEDGDNVSFRYSPANQTYDGMDLGPMPVGLDELIADLGGLLVWDSIQVVR